MAEHQLPKLQAAAFDHPLWSASSLGITSIWPSQLAFGAVTSQCQRVTVIHGERFAFTLP
jgi:hypothetical protein